MSNQPRRAYRFLDAITVLFVVVLLLSNIVAIKPVRVFGQLYLEGGIVLFPISYIFGDVLVEVYGFARARRVIWLGFAANVFMAAVFTLVIWLPGPPNWESNQAFIDILGQTPRIVAASVVAFWTGEFVNSYVMAKMKVWSEGRHLWTRTIGSTIAGEAVDTVLFITIAFYGVWNDSQIVGAIVGNYLGKVLYEIVATPLTYLIVGALKRAEQEDYYDRDTNFNPFVLNG